MDDSDNKQPDTGMPKNVYSMMFGSSSNGSGADSPDDSEESADAGSAADSSIGSSSSDPQHSSSSATSESTSTSSKPSSSSSADGENESEAEQQASAEAKNERLKAENDRDFANETESKFDLEPEGQTELRKAKNDLGSYIKETVKGSSDSKRTEHRLGELARAQTDLVRGIRLFETEYNHTICRLQKQIDVVDQLQQTYQKANPQESLDILKDWARTGMPSRIEHSYQKLAWVVNSPEFKEFLHDNKDENLDDTAIPKATQTRFDSEVQQDKKIAQEKSASASKGSNK